MRVRIDTNALVPAIDTFDPAAVLADARKLL